MKKTILIVLSVVILGILFIKEDLGVTDNEIVNKNASKKNSINIRVKSFKVKTFYQTINIFSTTKPAMQALLMTKAKGVISAINVKEGEYVKKGDIILEIESSDLESSKVASLKEIDRLVFELKSAQVLFDNGVGTLLNIKKIEAFLSHAEYLLESIKKEIRNTKVISNFNGYVQNFNYFVGDYLSLGISVAELVNLSHIEVEAFISQKYIRNLKVNDSVDILTDGRELKGKISYISKHSTDDTHTFKIKVISSKYDNLISGTTATLKMNLKKLHGIQVPPYLMLLSKNGYDFKIKTVFRERVISEDIVPIQSGDSGMWVSIKSKALGDELKLITIGHLSVNDGDLVNYKAEEVD